MASFRSVILLPAPPDVAWRFVEERGHEIEVFEFEPQGPQAAGVLNRLTVRVFGLPFRAVSRTITWDPPSVCAFESVRPSWPFRTHITEEFRPLDQSTEHVIDYEVTPSGAIGAIVAPIVCRVMNRNRRQYQERLRHALTEGRER